MMLMGLCTEFDIIDSKRDFEKGFFQYQVKCRVLRGTRSSPKALVPVIPWSAATATKTLTRSIIPS